MLKQYLRWRVAGLSHKKTWTEHDSYALCRSLDMILPTGRVDWVQCGRMTDVLSSRRLSESEARFKAFLMRIVMFRYAWWDGQRVCSSDSPRGQAETCRLMAAMR